ncbi:cysteine hydrolase family protein [Bacillus andreraoultii]|uniref:isochorismatase family protein n=1 Tax=Bacillus andreraoultii TaxID=1499685 RepID=UPI00067F3837|nr:isochorismatase family protein [Bacillus andreraoultii]
MLKTPFEQIVDVNKIGTSHARLNRILSLADDEIVKPSEEDQKKILFLGIDFQNDFMENGALGVPGAHEDVKNVTKFLYHNLHKVTTIAFSLDTHEPIQIFHPSWWVDDNGKYPKPLTIISSDDIESGKWHPIYKVEESKQYVLNLEREGKKKLCIWPYHCIEGTFGAALEGQLANLIYFHSVVRGTNVMPIVKGKYPTTEMYGIFRPEYSDTVGENIELLQKMKEYDQIVIAGEAKSHCVLESVIQLIEYFSRERENTSKIYLLEDCMSSIPGFEDDTEAVYKQLVQNYGIHLVESRSLEL